MQVDDIIKKYVGVPYATHGRSMRGMDCYGLVIEVFKDLGHDLFDISDYGETKEWGDRSYIIENYWRQWQPVSVPNFLDCAVFNLKGRPSHIGVMLDDNRFIHSFKRVNSVTVNRLSDGWRERLEGFYRLRGK